MYLENIYVTGIVTKYSEAGEPVGLCRASELYHVTTSGGPFDGRFGYDYWKTIAQDCFGIPTVKLLEAETSTSWAQTRKRSSTMPSRPTALRKIKLV